jgi:hypothetical protein
MNSLNTKNNSSTEYSFRDLKRGVTTLAVMTIVAITTIVAVGVYRAVTKDSRVQISRLQERSAESAARAGLAAAKSWFSYDAKAATAMLQNWVDTRDEGEEPGDWEIDPRSLLAQGDGVRENFRVFLTEMDYSKEPLTVKLQSIGYGQGNSKKVLTSIFEVEGMVVQVIDSLVPASSSSGASSSSDAWDPSGYFEDAFHINGTLENMDQLTNVDGSMYVDDGFMINAGDPVVHGNLAIGDEGSVMHWNTAPTIEGDFYSVKGLYWQSKALEVQGSAYIGGDIETEAGADIDGDLWTHGRMLAKSHNWDVDGNVWWEVGGTLEDGAVLRIGGDLVVGTDADSTANILGFRNSSTLNLEGDALFYGKTYAITGGPKNLTVNLTKTGVVQYFCMVNDAADWGALKIDFATVGPEDVLVLVNSKSLLPAECLPVEMSCATAAGGSLGTRGRYLDTLPTPRENLCDSVISVGSKRVQMPRYLQYMEEQLEDGNKPQPPGVDVSYLNSYKQSWSALLSHYGCGSGDFTASRANCVYTNMVNSADNFGAYNGYIVADMSSEINWNSIPGGILDGKFILLNVSGNINGRFPGSTPDSRVLIYMPSGANQFGIATPAMGSSGVLYGMVHVEGGGKQNYLGTQVVGAMSLLNGSGLQMNSGNAYSFDYDPTVIGDLVGLGIFVDGEGNRITPPAAGASSSSVASSSSSFSGTLEVIGHHLALLSPRLQLTLKAEYETEKEIDTANVHKPAPGLLIMPPQISIGQDWGESMDSLLSLRGVRLIPTNVPEGTTCNPQVSGAEASFSTPGVKIQRYTPGCGVAGEQLANLYLHVLASPPVATGEMSIHLDPAQSEVYVNEIDGDVVFYAYYDAYELSGDAVININTSGTATRGVDYELNTYALNFPAGTNTVDAEGSSTAQWLAITLSLLNDAELDEDEEDLIITLSVGSGNASVVAPASMRYIIAEDPGDHASYELNLYSTNGGGAYADPTLATYELGDTVVLKAGVLNCLDLQSWTGVTCREGNQTLDSCTYIVDATRSITANYDIKQYTLSPFVGGVVGDGRVDYMLESSGSWQNTSTLPQNFSCGDSLSLRAVEEGGVFNQWLGSVSDSSTAEFGFRISEDLSVGAYFSGGGEECTDSYTFANCPSWYSNEWMTSGCATWNGTGFSSTANYWIEDQADTSIGLFALDLMRNLRGGTLQFGFQEETMSDVTDVGVFLQDADGNRSRFYSIENPNTAQLHQISTANFESYGFDIERARYIGFYKVLSVNTQRKSWMDNLAYVCPNASTLEWVQPAEGAILYSNPTLFSWTEESGAQQYELQVGTTSGGNNIYSNMNITGTSANVSGIDFNGGTIYARVRALVAGTWRDWVESSWATGETPAFILPADGSTLEANTESFSWNNISGASNYEIYVGSSTGASDIASETTGSNTITISGLPEDGSTIYAQVRAQIGGTWGSWSSAIELTAFSSGGGGSCDVLGCSADNPIPGAPYNRVTVSGNAGETVYVRFDDWPGRGNAYWNPTQYAKYENTGSQIPRMSVEIEHSSGTAYQSISPTWYTKQSFGSVNGPFIFAITFVTSGSFYLTLES